MTVFSRIGAATLSATLSATVSATLSATVATGAVLALTAAPASAHTALESSNPKARSAVEAPTEITLKYNQPITLPRVILTDAQGGKHTAGAPRAVDGLVTQPVAGTLPNGEYTVGWRVVSADGHPVSGTFTFTVKGSPAPAGGGAASGVVTSAPASPQAAITLNRTTSSSEDDSGGSGGWLWLGLIALVVVAVGGAVAAVVKRRPSGGTGGTGA